VTSLAAANNDVAKSTWQHINGGVDIVNRHQAASHGK